MDNKKGLKILLTPLTTVFHVQRQRQPPVRYGVDEFVDIATEDQVCQTAYHACQIVEPQTIEEALKSDQAKERKAAAY